MLGSSLLDRFLHEVNPRKVCGVTDVEDKGVRNTVRACRREGYS